MNFEELGRIISETPMPVALCGIISGLSLAIVAILIGLVAGNIGHEEGGEE